MRPGTFGVPESLDLPFTTQTIGIFLAKENFFPYLPTFKLYFKVWQSK